MKHTRNTGKRFKEVEERIEEIASSGRKIHVR